VRIEKRKISIRRAEDPPVTFEKKTVGPGTPRETKRKRFQGKGNHAELCLSMARVVENQKKKVPSGNPARKGIARRKKRPSADKKRRKPAPQRKGERGP